MAGDTNKQGGAVKIDPERRRRELAEVEAALNATPYGFVELTLHEGRVTEIRETKKRRLE